MEKTPQELEKQGKSAYSRKDYPTAAQTFLAASQGYRLAGNALAAAEMSNNASVAFLQAGEAQAALEAVGSTQDVFAHAGDIRRQAMALGNRAAALQALNRFGEALDAYELSADLLKQVGDEELRLTVMQSISALQLRTGRHLEAVATMQAGLEDITRPSIKQRFLRKLLNNIPFLMLDR